jgi:hypothetical protein
MSVPDVLKLDKSKSLRHDQLTPLLQLCQSEHHLRSVL